MANTEQRLRTRCIKYAKAHGWTHIRLHFGAGAARGWPDDVFLKHCRQAVFVEFKAPAKGLSEIQLDRVLTLRDLGFRVGRCASFDVFRDYYLT